MDKNTPQQEANTISENGIIPQQSPQIDFIRSVIDLGNDISQIRDNLMSNLKLLEKDAIQHYIIKHLVSYLSDKITALTKDIDINKGIYEDKIEGLLPECYHILAKEIASQTFNRDIQRYYRYRLNRFLIGKDTHILESIKIPKKLDEHIKYNTSFPVIFFVEMLNVLNMGIKNKQKDMDKAVDFFLNVLIPKSTNATVNSMPKMEDMIYLFGTKDNLWTNYEPKKLNLTEKVINDVKVNLDESTQYLCFAIGVRQTSIRSMYRFLEYQREHYDNIETDFYDFAEDAIIEYKGDIKKNQRKKVKKWLKVQRKTNPTGVTTDNSSPLNIPDTPKIPEDKLVFTIDIKHFVYLMQALRKERTAKGQTLEANDGAIMGFITRNFCNKDCKPIKEKDLIPYFEEDTKSNKDMMTWNQTNTKLANVFHELFKEGDTPFLKCINMMKTLPKIISNSFTGKEKSILENTIRRSLKDDRRPSKPNRCPVYEHMNLKK